jgi:hypothetical protein
MQIVITGHDLPGRMFRSAGVPLHDVHVALQVRSVPEGLVPGDAESATWRLDVRVTAADDGFDFAGPAVHGRRGERFLYLTWGDVGPDGTFSMFRRAKLMLGRVEPELIRRALADGLPLRASVGLTDGYGGPRCARVDPPHLAWSV